MRNRTWIYFWLLPAALQAQTQVDLRTQSKAVDFSAAASTQPAKKGTTLPGTCVAGEQFFKTDATAGQNLYLCAAANTWTQSGQIPATVAATNQSNTYTAGTQDFSGAAHTLPALKGTTAAKPATCTPGEQYFATDATAGQNLFFCTAANTWTQELNSGNCPNCVTAPAALTNLNIMAGAGSQASKITNITADTGLNNLLVPGTVSTGDGSAAGELLLYELAANGTAYFSWLGVDSRTTTLRAQVPATDPTAGQVMLFGAPVGGISTITWGNPGSGGGGSGAPNYTQSFTSATSVSLTHGLGTKNLIVACLDANDAFIEPAAWSIGQTSPFNIAVTFATAQTGRCVVNGTGVAKFGTTFTSQTSVSISGATHNLGSSDLEVACYDASAIRNRIEPDRMTVDPATNNLVVTFFAPQSGRCVVM